MKQYEVFFKTANKQGSIRFESDSRKGSRRNQEDAVHALYVALGWSGCDMLEILSIERK